MGEIVIGGLVYIVLSAMLIAIGVCWWKEERSEETSDTAEEA